LKTIGATQLVVSCQLIGSSAREAEKRWLCSLVDSELIESQPVKRRHGGWCEMATSLVVELRWLCTEAVNIEPEHAKLKNLHC
jgi:hypothetical protein